jgi:multidrug efflux pump subunit AcrA (membrane-fusion protein)
MVSPRVAWRETHGTGNMMLFNLKTVGVLLFIAGAFGTGAAVSRVSAPPVDERPAAEAPKRVAPAERKDLVRVACSRDGIIAEMLVKEGEIVKEGQLLLRVDDRVAAADIKIKEVKLEASIAEALASEKTRDETYQRWQTQIRLLPKAALSKEDVRAAEMSYVRQQQEAVAKKEAINLAKAELEQAQIILDLHRVYSPANGMVHTLLKKRGEAVNRLETVLILRTGDEREAK